MAAVEVTISGMLYDKVNRTTQNVVLIGEATLTGLGIGGGPIIPPVGDKPPRPPLGIWPNPPEGIAPLPEHPIVIPPPVPPDMEPPPPLMDWKVAWTPDTGWIVVGVPQVPHPVPSK